MAIDTLRQQGRQFAVTLVCLVTLAVTGCSGRNLNKTDVSQAGPDTSTITDILNGEDSSDKDVSTPPVDTEPPQDNQGPEDISPGDVVDPTPDQSTYKDITPIEVNPGGDPVVAQQGDNKSYLIRGTVVTMEQDQAGEYVVHLQGEVRVEGNKIACVGALDSCGTVAGTTVIESNGVIFPGMIDAHNHILYAPFSEADVWAAGKLFYHHDSWTKEPEYDEMQAAYNHLLNTPVNIDCEVLKYGEIKAIIGGTTSVVGSAKGSPQKCFSSLARSIDGPYNDLDPSVRCSEPPDSDHMQVHALGLAAPADLVAIKANLDSCITWAYVVHVGEGVHTCPLDKPDCNKVPKGEWDKVIENEMDRPEVAIVHGTALSKADFQHMYDKKMKLVWSPKSNIYLYDQTTRINLILDIEAEAKLQDPNAPELVIALAPDWSIGGSVNLFDELNFAYGVDQARWGGRISFERFVRMVTIDAAKSLEIHGFLGSLKQGKYADLIIIAAEAKTKEDAYKALVGARPQQLGLVMVNGVFLYGNSDIAAVTTMSGCDTLTVCGEQRFFCVAETGTENKIKQTYGEIVKAIEDGLKDYKTQNPGKSDYLPLAPIVKCD